ncbi:hypothetical protein HG535_0E03730 [Zygotorulaspora mrakii]|uniref:Uncharacterized protein n=1 Tax=Zygotorulaspora mrakii TaxID=42260 RepID=A0A7H9B5Q2_ZYGMR|nr:uncharacterized protein HG535_0E03730 [Zygotorulaspora mrakii]QLG73289.1 hypothetical protein HG535_0E03730 [Zygotorulaspora mrakii]
MASQELLTRYITEGLLTNQISFEEFDDIITKSAHNRISKESIRDWYLKYQSIDSMAYQTISKGVCDFLKKLKESVLNDLEKGQVAESFTLEEIINNLYTVDQILNSRLKTMNKRIAANALELESFNNILTESHETRQQSANSSLDGLLNTLKRYKALIEDVDRGST